VNKIKERVHLIENDIIVNKDRTSINNVIKTHGNEECVENPNVSDGCAIENKNIIKNDKEMKIKEDVARIVHANDEMINEIEK